MPSRAEELFARLWRPYDRASSGGVNEWQYAEQLVFLLFLKMEHERGTRGFRATPRVVDEGLDWSTLVDAGGAALEVQYLNILTELGKERRLVGSIFRRAQNPLTEPALLAHLITDVIDPINWSREDPADRGRAFELVLERAAVPFNDEAGQYLTARPLIDAIVECVRPGPDDTICDPACGTAGFMVAAYRHILRNHGTLDRDQSTRLATGAINGSDIDHRIVRLGAMNLIMHGVAQLSAPELIHTRDALAAGADDKASVVLTDPPFRSNSAHPEGREDFFVHTNNLQFNFVQHVASVLDTNGRAAMLVPDNVLFQGGAGEGLRRVLLTQFDVHTLLRLPKGISASGGVRSNVLFFDRTPPRADGRPATSVLWVYDLRTGLHFATKERPLRADDLADFVANFRPGRRAERAPSERFKPYPVEELLREDGLNLYLRWLPDPDLGEGDVDLPPKTIAREIAADLRSAMLEFEAVADSLPDPED